MLLESWIGVRIYMVSDLWWIPVKCVGLKIVYFHAHVGLYLMLCRLQHCICSYYLQISDSLGAENLRALKNLCYDCISKPQYEAVETGLDIFNALIEKSELPWWLYPCINRFKAPKHSCTSLSALIDANNVAFLCELLDEIGRKDLTDEVKLYIERSEG